MIVLINSNAIILAPASFVMATVFAVTAMHEHVHEWASKQQQIGKNAEQVRPMFRKKEEGNDCQEDEEHNASSRAEPTAVS